MRCGTISRPVCRAGLLSVFIWAWEGEISPRSNGSLENRASPVLMWIKSQKHIKTIYEARSHHLRVSPVYRASPAHMNRPLVIKVKLWKQVSNNEQIMQPVARSRRCGLIWSGLTIIHILRERGGLGYDFSGLLAPYCILNHIIS
jgi:hypothetical protein